jgi:uncharacterized membrane protein
VNFRILYVFAIGVVENLFVFALLMAIIYDGLACSGLSGAGLGLFVSLIALGSLSMLTLRILCLLALTVLLALAPRFVLHSLFVLLGSLLGCFLSFLKSAVNATANQNGYEYEDEEYEKHKTKDSFQHSNFSLE